MKAVILATPQQKNKGVIGRESLDLDEVYVFNNIYEDQAFHMQGVKFDVDIAFLDEGFGILKISTMESESGRAKAPEGTAFAVEASKGYFEERNLKAGDFWTDLHNTVNVKKY